MSTFNTPPMDAIAALVNCNASAPYSSMMSNGSITFPVDFDISCLRHRGPARADKPYQMGSDRPLASCIIIILAPRKQMSCPVIRVEVGKYLSNAAFCSGQPNVRLAEAELNHVSKTSGSRVSALPCACACASARLPRNTDCPHRQTTLVPDGPTTIGAKCTRVRCFPASGSMSFRLVLG